MLIGTPNNWCSTMVITVKKMGNQDSRLPTSKFSMQTGNTPHQLAIPTVITGTTKLKKKSRPGCWGWLLLSISLDEESQPQTTFIMECGHFMHLRMPQGYLDSGYTYVHRYDKIIKDVPCKVKIVNDTLLFDKNIEEAFYHTLDYLLLCEKNGIILNREKFQFCQNVVQFEGFK